MRNASFLRFAAWLTLAVLSMSVEPSLANTNGVLDSVQQTIQTASSGWMSQSLGYANDLFFGLAGLEFVWSAIQLTLRKNELPDIIVGTLFKVMGLAFFAMLLQEAPTWIPDIISSFTQAGTAVGGGGVPLTPSQVIDQGINLASNIITQGMNVNGTQNGGLINAVTSGGASLGGYMLAAIVIGLTGIMIILSFAVIALQLFVTLVESYLVIGGGAIMLGFLGSRWTTNFGEKYFGYAVSVGIKLFTLYLIIGFGQDLVTQMGNQLTALTSGGNGIGMGDWLAMGGTSLVYGGVGYMVPSLASTMMNGSPNMTMSNMGAAAGGMAAAPVAAGLAVGAAGTRAAGLMGKAFDSTKSGAAGGISGSSASGGGFAGSITGGTAGLSRLTQGGSAVMIGMGSATQLIGQGTSMAGKGIQAARSAAAAIPGVGTAIAAAGKVAGAGGEVANKAVGKATEAAGSAMKQGGDAIGKASEAAVKTGSTPTNVESKPGGNGFTSATGAAGGGQNETGGMIASNAESANAQRVFDIDQKPDKSKSLADRLLDKSDDLQRAADKHKPNLVHDGGHGSGISIRFSHEY